MSFYNAPATRKQAEEMIADIDSKMGGHIHPVFAAKRAARREELVTMLPTLPEATKTVDTSDDGSWDRYCTSVRADLNAERRLEYRGKRR